MPKLPKYTLFEKMGYWVLERDSNGQVVKKFDTKAEATAGGALRQAVGGIGSVKIQKLNGRIQEERTYPRSADPKKSKG